MNFTYIILAGSFSNKTFPSIIYNNLEIDVEILKKEICDLKSSVTELTNKLETLNMSDNTVAEVISDEENSTDLTETVETINKIDLINVQFIRHGKLVTLMSIFTHIFVLIYWLAWTRPGD